MKFTVIIPVYNSSNTIARALDSLVNQSLKDFEVVLVDDASNDFDQTLQVVQTFKTLLSLRVFRNLTNKNGSFSRNRGIEEARGEYVAFLDSDDIWVPNRLQAALELIESGIGERFIIYGKFELIRSYSTGALLPLRGIRKGELVADYVFAASQHMQTSTFVCPVNVASEIFFDVSLTRHQDSDFMMRAQQSGVNIVYQAQKCAKYFFRPLDLRERVISGRISSDFCLNWMNVKQEYLSTTSIAGYKLTVLSRIVYVESGFIKSLVLIFTSVLNIGFSNFMDLVKAKMYVVYKSRLGL